MESLANVLSGLVYNEFSEQWEEAETGKPIIWGGGLVPPKPEPKAPKLDLKRTESRTFYSSEVGIRKCKCGASWCQECWVSRGLKNPQARLRKMDYRRVRHVVATQDEKIVGDGFNGYFSATRDKAIANMIRNLERTKNIKVIDWVWFLEWHKSGLPHWHILIEVEKIGPRGQIYWKNIKQYWHYGNVEEGYIRSSKHWEEMTGYFSKNGYFQDSKDEKKHQITLPDWAMSYTGTIRRYGGKQRRDDQLNKKELDLRNKRRVEKRVNENIVNIETGEVLRKVREVNRDSESTYEMRLEKCGSKTLVEYNDMDYQAIEIIDVPYEEFKRFERKYDEKEKVLKVQLKKADIIDIIDKYQLTKTIVNFIIGGYSNV